VTTSLEPNLPLKEQDQESLTIEVCKMLDRLAVIYQVPNYDMKVNSILLAEWVLENYKHHDFDLIRESLRNPPKNDFNTWRLTPDSISEWIEHTRIKRADKAIAEESRIRQETEVVRTPFSPETEKMIQDFKNMLLDGIKRSPEMTPEEIKANGQLRPKAFKVPSTDSGYVKEWLVRMKTHQEKTYRDRHPNCTDQEVQNFLNKL